MDYDTEPDWSKEVWKPCTIQGFTDKFHVSSFGRVKEVNTGRMLRQMNDAGYLRVTFRRGHQYRVHRLVALAFIPDPKQLGNVNHKNAIKTDNVVENLEWTTRGGNIKHARDLGIYEKNQVRGVTCWSAKLSVADVLDIRRRYSDGENSVSLSRRYPVSARQITSIVRRRNWAHV